MKLNRTDRAWIIALLQKYDEIEIGIKAGTHYTRELTQIKYWLGVYLKKEFFESND